MAVITTRQNVNLNELEVQEVLEQLVDIMDEATNGLARSTLKQIGPISTTDKDVVLESVRVLVGLQRQLLEEAATDMIAMSQHIGQLNVELSMMDETFAKMLTVPFDEVLDHAAEDVMDAIESFGTSTVDSDGDLVFNERTTISKADLKSILSIGISRWVQLKSQY